VFAFQITTKRLTSDRVPRVNDGETVITFHEVPCTGETAIIRLYSRDDVAPDPTIEANPARVRFTYTCGERGFLWYNPEHS